MLTLLIDVNSPDSFLIYFESRKITEITIIHHTLVYYLWETLDEMFILFLACSVFLVFALAFFLAFPLAFAG